MAHHHQASALTLVLAVSIGADARAWQTATDTSPLDLRRNEANAARVERTLPAGAIRVTFEPAPWPSVRFPAPAGRAWDWNAYGHLLLELNNPDRQAIKFGVRIDDDRSADGRVHCRTAQGEIKPGEAAT